ncbi:protein TolB [Streptomyces flavofungini]|uniref:protein TolB n=1 Tax=Streptomyces flavofungini TaxID=68200 RepID=UPI0025B02FCE|nr:protein TolB [Streptomyces flavofungini]WJV45968.1 protein TolB [Streptomyces flavofungini]
MRRAARAVSAAALATALAAVASPSAAHAARPAEASGTSAPSAAAERSAPRVERVSVAADGTEANGASGAATVTKDGGHVAFSSAATNLTPDTHPRPQSSAHIRDQDSREVSRIRESLTAPSISDDGRFATYLDWGSHTTNAYVMDLTTGEKRRVDAKGFKEGSGESEISADGRHVAYVLRPQHPADPYRIEVYDWATDTREVVSDGPPDAARDMVNPSISDTGRFVAYEDAGTQQVWVRDRDTGSLRRVDDGTASELVEISGDGRTVVLNSANGAYVRDLRSGKVRHFSGTSAKAVGPDGRHLLYSDDASTLRLRDLRTGRVHVVGTGSAVPGAVGAKGRTVVYTSAETDVVPGDTNGVSDVFIRHTR